MNIQKTKKMVRGWLKSEACIDRLEQIHSCEIDTLRLAAKLGDTEAREILGRLALQGQQ